MLLWRTSYLVTVCAGINYLFWLYGVLDWHVWFLAIPFFICELWFIINFLCTGTLAFARETRKHWHSGTTASPLLEVAVLIPVCGEAKEIVGATIDSALAISYAGNLKIFVTDDKSSDDIKNLALQKGVIYLTHPPHEEAKAGNMNRALPEIMKMLPAVQWLLVIDSGDIVRPDILEHAVPYFSEERVGFVQVQRRFDMNNLPSDTGYFYDVIIPKRDRCDAMFSCGSGAFWKIEALMELGGFSTWNIVEDYTTSYELQKKGWHGRYVLKPLHIGIPAADINSLIRQRYQWACDALRLAFWKNPLLDKTLSLPIRWAYVEVAASYLLAFPVFVIRTIPLVVLWFDFPLFHLLQRELDYWVYFAPFFGARVLCDFTEFFAQKTPFCRLWGKQLSLHEGLIPLYIMAVIQTFAHGPEKKPRYQVTPKKADTRFQLYAVRFQIVWFCLNLLTILYGFQYHSTNPWLITATIWLLYSSLLLMPFISAATATMYRGFRICWNTTLITAWLGGLSVLALELIKYFN